MRSHISRPALAAYACLPLNSYLIHLHDRLANEHWSELRQLLLILIFASFMWQGCRWWLHYIVARTIWPGGITRRDSLVSLPAASGASTA